MSRSPETRETKQPISTREWLGVVLLIVACVVVLALSLAYVQARSGVPFWLRG